MLTYENLGYTPQEVYHGSGKPVPAVPVISLKDLWRSETFDLPLKVFKQILEEQRLEERHKYALWIVRRIIYHMESARRTDGRSFTLSKGGKMRSSGRPSDAMGLLESGRLLWDVRGVLGAYGCPDEYTDNAIHVINLKLQNLWGLTKGTIR